LKLDLTNRTISQRIIIQAMLMQQSLIYLHRTMPYQRDKIILIYFIGMLLWNSLVLMLGLPGLPARNSTNLMHYFKVYWIKERVMLLNRDKCKFLMHLPMTLTLRKNNTPLHTLFTLFYKKILNKAQKNWSKASANHLVQPITK
jgi:hypothetical protein